MTSVPSVDWTSALGALGDDRAWAAPVLPPSLSTEVRSLSGLGCRHYPSGMRELGRAIDADPYNPLHRQRRALLHMRFGRWDAARRELAVLQELVPDSPYSRYLSGLVALRCGDFAQAKTAATDLAVSHARFPLRDFLEVEAKLRNARNPKAIKGLAADLRGLPRGAEHEGLWADLLGKLILIGGKVGAEIACAWIDDTGESAPGSRGVRPPGIPSPFGANSRSAALLRRLLAWESASLDRLEEATLTVRGGTRAEELVLLLFRDRCMELKDETSQLRRLHRARRRAPGSEVLRALQAEALTRHAVSAASEERYEESLRAVVGSHRLQPHVQVHLQNRAALFTLMRDREGYHEAWADLDRHHYRMCLLGQLDRESARTYASPHAMFALAARLTSVRSPTGGRRSVGIFREETDGIEPGRPPGLRVNQRAIDADPELLRQWIHHRRAALTFRHWALGVSPERFLLVPSDRNEAGRRLEGLSAMAGSLAVLVPDEGAKLADRLSAHWQGWYGGCDVRYEPTDPDREVDALRREHLQNLADLARLCFDWNPDGIHAQPVWEIVEFLAIEAPFFDDRHLAGLLEGPAAREIPGLLALRSMVAIVLGLDEPETRLTREQRNQIAGRFASKLLISAALNTYNEQRSSGDKAADAALPFIDEARLRDPTNPDVEWQAARLLATGRYFSEATAALARFERLGGTDDPAFQSEIDRVDEHLRERKQLRDRGRRRAGAPEPEAEDAPTIPPPEEAKASGSRDQSTETPQAPDQAPLEDLERAVERLPSSVRGYEELARFHAVEGDFELARRWSSRAITRCLGRRAQIRARTLDLEMTGLQQLAALDSQAVSAFLGGDLTRAAESIALRSVEDARTGPLCFLLGQCQLDAGEPETARSSFQLALQRVGRTFHRSVIRPLARDTEQAYISQLVSQVQTDLAAGETAEALGRIEGAMEHLRRPAPLLLSLARLFQEEAARRIAQPDRPHLRAAIPVKAPWAERFAQVCAFDDDLVRSREMATLAMEHDPPSRAMAEALIRQLEALWDQRKVADVLAASTWAFQGGDPGEALAILDRLAPELAVEPQVLRHRILLLLGLERFAEADRTADALGASASTVAREFLERYPVLACERRLGQANRKLREGAVEEALELLSGVSGGDEEQGLELGYCRAFAFAMMGFRQQRGGRLADALRDLTAALAVLERYQAAARERGHTRLLRLCEKVDDAVDQLQEKVRG